LLCWNLSIFGGLADLHLLHVNFANNCCGRIRNFGSCFVFLRPLDFNMWFWVWNVFFCWYILNFIKFYTEFIVMATKHDMQKYAWRFYLPHQINRNHLNFKRKKCCDKTTGNVIAGVIIVIKCKIWLKLLLQRIAWTLSCACLF